MAALGVNVGARTLDQALRFGSKAALMLAFLVAGGAFSLQLSGLAPHAPVGPDSASLQSEIAIGAAYLVIGVFGVSARRRVGPLLHANSLVLALPALALLSAAWAPEPMVALRRAMAFTATVLSGVALVAAMPGAKAFRFLAQAAALAMALSLAYVAAAPAFGLHQATDGVQSVHAGDWRGVFIHRTILGRLAALCLAMAVYGRADTFGSVPVRAGVILSSILCLVMARSGGGFASAAILLATPAIVQAIRLAARRNRLMAFGLGAGGVLLAALSAPILAPAVLALLGKAPTLTGRTDLWPLMLQAGRERPLFGYGYSTGFREVVARLVADRTAYGYVPNAQNGYLDVWLNLGGIGLALALGALGLGVWRAIRLAMRPPPFAAILPLLIVVFIAETNMVEAALISANDIFVLIYVAALIASGEAARRPSCAVNRSVVSRA